jgi:anti-sigma regulatory factor (Ser/Thr protein kinase)
VDLVGADGDGRGSDAKVSRWRYPPSAEVLGGLRRRVHAVSTGWGLTHGAVEDVVTIANELVSNAIEHAGTSVLVVLGVGADGVSIWVRDQSRRLPVLRSAEGDPTRGWGLRMVDVLASWGWTSHPDGKTVWACVPHPPRRLRSVPL